jgi:cyclophilin family peptidyl-prolyl cis-trans isomerase
MLQHNEAANKATWRDHMSANRKAEVDAAVKDVDFSKNKYQVELDTTLGKITLDLNSDVAPGHCKNMIGLAKIGYYDGVLFHRIIKGFMIQGGCPLGTGTGGPGYTINAEFNTTPHEAGVLSMARTSDPNSGGSQFFLCLGRHTHLDRQYTAFGKTADEASLAVVRKIGEVKTDSRDRPVSDVTIKTASVIAKAK